MVDFTWRGTLVYGDPAQPIPVTGTFAAAAPVGGPYTDRSIPNLTGASQQLMAANANRKALGIFNIATNNIAVNLTGGAASLTVAGSVVLVPGGSIVFDVYPPSGVINVIGTANDDLTAWEG